MAQKDTGEKIATDVHDAVTLKSLRDKAKNFFSGKKEDASAKKPDTAWRDSMLQKANDSFKKQEQPSVPPKQAPKKVTPRGSSLAKTGAVPKKVAKRVVTKRGN